MTSKSYPSRSPVSEARTPRRTQRSRLLAWALCGIFPLAGCASFGLPGSRSWEGSFLRDESPSERDEANFTHRWSGPAREDEAGENEDGPGVGSSRNVRPGDISVGMSLQEVRESWGSPRDVEFAGESRRGNQRWIFPLGADPRISPARVIYFERGRVVGWETVHP